jgi:NADH:ubiquinone oxidoreductase subunit F (NADH-binding)
MTLRSEALVDVDVNGVDESFAASGVVGDAATRLLAGPRPERGAESLAEHDARLGSAGPRLDLSELRASGLRGRGGGGFPFVRKVEATRNTEGDRLVVVNASESEPASRKDMTLLELRPHLVLDGAAAAAALIEARTAVVYSHHRDSAAAASVGRALRERAEAGRGPGLTWSVADAPAQYLAGESSAVVAVLEGRGALPALRRLPVAVAGVRGRPTLVSNAETFAHAAQIARFGAGWFRAAGTDRCSGSTLVTLAGAVRAPGLVVEVVEPVPLHEVLTTYGGLRSAPRAVLLGGYGGCWIDGRVAWDVPVDRDWLERASTGLGCGLIAVLADGACGLAETVRLARYLAAQTSGQCGPCFLGLPDIGSRLAELADGTGGGARQIRRTREILATITGRGACGHPDGAVRMVESALEVFGPELRSHTRRGRGHCPGKRCTAASGFPLTRVTAPRAVAR